MSNLIPFEYEGKPVRIVQKDGEPWFVAADVCAVLDLSNVTMALEKLDDDERAMLNIDSGNTLSQIEGNRGNPNVNIITEPGMYKLVLRSNKPTAKPFIRFVTHDVLPAIRKTGRYEAPNAPGVDATLPDPGMLARLVNSASRIGGAPAGKAVLNRYGIIFDTDTESVTSSAQMKRLHTINDDKKERVYGIIFRAGKKGIVKNILTRKTQFLDGSYERDNIIVQLSSEGRITFKEDVVGKNTQLTFFVKPRSHSIEGRA